jgi:uncharacterized integral membrane protein
MIRLLLWLVLGLPIGFVLVSMAVTSNEEVGLRLWPLAYEWRQPVGLMVMAAVLIAFFAGMIVAWIVAGRTRARMRAQRRQIEDLRDQIAAIHARLGQQMAAQDRGRRGLPKPESRAA